MMMMDTQQEQEVNEAFSKQSAVFDEIDESNQLLLWMRDRVRKEVLRYIKPNATLLELNCGTGIDALFFAGKGIKVLATDNAPGMLQQLNTKIKQAQLEDLISAERCSFNHLDRLASSHRFDYIFSNFGGLNCTDDLATVLHQMDKLLKPGGYFTLVIMPRICPWEMLLVLKGDFKTAFRRFKKGGTRARVEGVHFNCYYYSPDYIIRHLGPYYELTSLKGLATFIPPPYIEQFVERHPRLFRFLEWMENNLSNKWPFNKWGDHFTITMQKTA
jgi:ubiquinone/menaquinone biosynthesis C-methylase UbiE